MVTLNLYRETEKKKKKDKHMLLGNTLLGIFIS